MINTAEIFIWGTRIGIIHKEPDLPYASFEYDRDFQKSGIELSPICMPLSDHVYEFPDLSVSSFHGMPGLVADSLPDRFGNAVINNWLSSLGRSVDYFNAIDRLCYTGSRGMGALEYVPASGPFIDPSENVNISEMVRFAEAALSGRAAQEADISNDPAYAQLLKLGTSAGGARAKAIIAWNEDTGIIRSGQIDAGDGFDYWLIKFDGVDSSGDHNIKDIPEYTLIEYAYYQMAVQAGIEMSECRLYREHDRSHFMTKRFDRVNGNKLHMQTLGALTHTSYNDPGFLSYEQAASYMRFMGLPAADIEQLFRRMVFNVLAVNQDDHVKNISFLMNKAGIWRLAPAYDLTFAYSRNNLWLSTHQMVINGKRSGITLDDILTSGASMDISPRKCRNIIEKVRAAVSNWSNIAHDLNIRDSTIETIEQFMIIADATAS